MRIRNLHLPLVLVAALAGCNTTMPQQSARMSTDDDPSRKCYSSLGDDAQLLPLHSKVGKPSDLNSATLPMLASTERVSTDAERKAIQYWAEVRNTCLDAGKRFREIHQPPMYSGIVESQNSQFVVLLSRLYSGALTYGEFNTQRRELSAKNADNWRNAQAQERQANATQQQIRSAEQARQAAEFNNAMLMMQASRPQPVANPLMNQPISCQSRAVGGVVHTDCR